MAADLPTGLVTFLFTDIEGSTKLWQADAPAMEAALARHDAVLAHAIESAGGRLFKHTGDGVCAVFGSPAPALEAAISAQRELQLPVRMGIHTGDAQERSGDFFGPTLNRCARLMDAGHGGQILLSEVTKALIETVEVTDLGEHLLKDLAVPERIFQVGTGQFPRLRLKHRQASLPLILTSLVGRDDLVTDVCSLLSSERLVTLVGMGGVGKTRVAVAAAERVVDQFDRTVFVDLAQASDEPEVLPTLARALELTTPSRNAVSLALSDRSVLLVIDNCEHVIDAAADLVIDLLATSATTHVLATSREGLAVDGERLVAVPGLDSGHIDSASVALFMERARSAHAEVTPDSATVKAAVELCRHLDGIPLAIELAASRLRTMTVHELVERLDDRFQVLTGGRRRRSRDRHRTLRETIDWSFELLDPEEQEVFLHLAVFPASFDVAAASAVLDHHNEVGLLDVLGSLVDKSMLTTTHIDDSVRYRFLETVRTYGEERLDQLGETDQALTRLAAHLAEVVRGSVDDLFSGAGDGAGRIRMEIPNMRRALDFALEQRDVSVAAALVEPLAAVWGSIDWLIDGWADEILELPEASGHRAEPALLVLRATDIWLNGGFGQLEAATERALDAAGIEPDGQELGPWWVHRAAAILCRLAGVGDIAGREGVKTDRALNDAPEDVALFGRLTIDAFLAHSNDWEVILSPSDLRRGLSHPSNLIRHATQLLLTNDASAKGDHESMLEAARAAVEYGIEGGGTWFGSLQQQAIAQLRLGRLQQALDTADLDLNYAYRFGDRSAMFVPLGIYAIVLKLMGEAEAAALTRGWLPRTMTIMLGDELLELDRWLVDTLEPSRLEELRKQGRSMAPSELVAKGREAAESSGIAP